MVHIALGYDDSPAARSALEWVGDRVTDAGDRVVIVTVTNMIASNYRKVEHMLDDASRRLRELTPSVQVESHYLDGTMPDALVADARDADLLVIGVHDARLIRDLLTGWMPVRLAARAHSPVCLVPEGWTANDLPVLVGADDDPSSDAALTAAADAAVQAGVPLHVVHTWSMPTPTLEGSVALLASPLEVKESHRKILKEAVARVRASHPGLQIEEELVSSGPGAGLLHRTGQSSLLVLGSHRRGVFVGGLLGSVAQDVLGHTECPVMIVPTTS